MSVTPPIPGPTGSKIPPREAPAEDSTRLETLLDSRTLLQGQRTIAILHNGTVYRLQATRQGKLILTK